MTSFSSTNQFQDLSPRSSEDEEAHFQDGQEDQIFSCRLENSKVMTDILTAIHGGGKEQICEVKASSRALVFSVIGRGKSTQARATLQADIFEEYIFESCRSRGGSCGVTGDSTNSTATEGVMLFSINLTTLLDCLHLFGSTSESTAATLTYSNLDALFKVSLEESGVLTSCNIVTFEPDINVSIEEASNSSLYAQFREHPETCRFILKADPIKDAIQDMYDVVGGGDVTFRITRSPEEMFELSVRGSLDQFEVEFPKSSGAFVMFECLEETCWAYLNASIQLGMKALSISKETFIRINGEGLMSIQHLVKEKKSGADIEPYIDFFILPVENQLDNHSTLNAR